MKLQCEVEVVNRELPSYGMRSRGKGTRAVLSVGRQDERQSGGKCGPIYLMICTLRDKAGSRYKLQENIEHLFTKFLEEGKATVRLQEPRVDICLSKAESCSLKNFISALRLAHKGTDVGSVLSRLVPAKTADIEKPRTKMFITSKKDYPITKNFPFSLEHLQVSYCKLARFDMRMLCLKRLQKLDLSNNHIKKLPKTIGDLACLQELNLNHNFLESFEVLLCNSSWRNTLKSLDLSENKLKALPVQFGHFKELVSLKLDKNELIQLPFTIGQLSKLRFLSATNNKLPYLPNSFKMLALEKVDLFENPFVVAAPMVPDIQLKVPLSLLECAARVTIQNQVPLGPHVIPTTLCQDLSLAKLCDCGQPCLYSFIQTVVLMNLHQVSQTVVLMDTMGGTDAPIICYFCCLSCYSQFLDKYLQSTRI